MLLEPGRRDPELGRVGHEPGEDEDAGRLPHERLGHREQLVDARLVRDRNEDRPLCDRPGSRRRCLDSQRGVVPEDRPLELLKRRARVDSEPVDERPARVLVRLERLGLPAAPVQRRHQLAPESLAERFLRDERLELSDQLVDGDRARGRRRSGARALPA